MQCSCPLQEKCYCYALVNEKFFYHYGRLGLIAFLVSIVYLGMMLSVTNGRFVAPLDDAYIHFQYARQMAVGQPWSYNTGESPTTGATSLLYPFLLAIAYRLGFQGEWLVSAALIIGIVCLAFSTILIYRLTEILLRIVVGEAWKDTHIACFLAALLFLLTGGIQWGFLNGMESGLFTLFVLAGLMAYLQKQFGWAGIWLALAALTRPEGIFLLGLWWFITLMGHRNGLRLPSYWWRITLPLLIGCIPFFLNWWLSGSVAAAGAQAKSWLGNVPFRFGDIIGSILTAYVDILLRLSLGFLAPKSWFILPGLLPLAGIGWYQLYRAGQKNVAILTTAWFFIGNFSTATLITSIWQYGRYQLPFLALLFPVAVIGLVAGWQKIVGTLLIGGHNEPDDLSPLQKRWLGWLKVSGVFLLFFATSHTSFIAWQAYRQSVVTVKGQALALADWIESNLPPESYIAVHDAGAIRYIGERPIYDMIGLTTPGQTPVAWKHGMGAVFELMEQTSPLPTHFATYPDVFSIPYLTQTSLTGMKLYETTVPGYSPITAANDTQIVYQADWSLADSGSQPYQADILQKTAGRTLRQQIDLADLVDEAANGLTWWEGAVWPGFATDLQQLPYRTSPKQQVLDGGRLLSGGLAWTTTVIPGQDLLLAARLHSLEAGAVIVYVNQQEVGQWAYPALPGEWLETAFTIPAKYLSSSQITIELVATATNITHFAIYHLWVWQGRGKTISISPVYPLAAQLGDTITLVGYDLPAAQWQAGDMLPLDLYWQALGKPTLDSKVFVHLYDEAGTLVSQQDDRPYYGTRPPYTWESEEIISDSYQLLLPPDLSNGRYYLAVGMYQPGSGVRLPLQTDPNHTLPDDRILLQTIQVTTQ